MRIHPVTRQIAHGIAGDGVYVDGIQIAPGGGENGMPDWLDMAPIWCGSAGNNFAFLRASQVGVWAGWTSLGGVATSWGLKLPKAVLFDMSTDGTMLVGDNYQSGVGLSAYKAGDTTPAWTVASARPEMRFPYAQAAILDAQTACWTENVGGRMVLGRVGLPAGPRPPWSVLHPRLFKVNGAVWVAYLRAEDDRTIAHPWDYRGLGCSVPGFGYGPDAWSDGETATLCWSVGAGERSGDIRTQRFTLSEIQDIPPVPVPAPDTFGPIGPPLPAGTTIDLVPYFIADPALFPRTGTHPIHQHWDGTRLLFMKFDPAQFPKRDRYEEMRIGENYIHQITDASNERLVGGTDTRWFPKVMKVGYEHRFDTGPHELWERDRKTCQEVGGRAPWRRRMWIHEAWAEFDCGPDLGKRPVVCVVHDPNDGHHGPGRGIERYYQALGAGFLRWEWHHAGLVWASGTPVFSDDTIGVNPDGSLMRSDFYRFGGPAWTPNISTCPLPMSPDHPDPIPPIPPVPPMTTDTLKPGDVLKADVPLVSQDKRFTLLYQQDGNLVNYGPSGPLWANGKTGTSVGFVSMQGDGNFVQYDKAGRPVWATNTHGHPGAWCILQNDGNQVIYSVSGKPLWASNSVYVPAPIPPTPTPGPVEPVVAVRVDGKVFRRPDGRIYQSKSATSFLLLRRLLEEGEAPVREYLAQFYAIGARELRVFSRVNWNGSPGPGLFPDRYPNYWQAFNRLFTLAAEQGVYLEMVALTGPEVGTGWVQQCQEQRSKHVNAFLEVSNEPPVNGIDIERIMAELGSSTGSWSQPWATGQYYPTAMPSGTFCTVHTDRVDGWEWVRKAIKDILEYREGGGPYEPTDPAMLRPIKGDEPMGAASFHSAGRRDNVPVHHFTAAAGSMLFGAGYCVHHESGLNSIFPSGVELECVSAAFKGMNTVGPDWQLGEYGRVGLAHFPIPEDPSVRTYGMQLGNRWKVVRVGPTTPMPVIAPGWRVDKVDSYAGLNIVLELVQG